MQTEDQEKEHASRSPFYSHSGPLEGSFGGPPNGVGSTLPGQRFAPERAASSSLASQDGAHFYRGLSSSLASGLTLAQAGSGLSYEGESPRGGRAPMIYRQRSDGAHYAQQQHPARPAYGGRGSGLGDFSGYHTPRALAGGQGAYGGRGPPGSVREHMEALGGLHMGVLSCSWRWVVGPSQGVCMLS